MDIPVYLVAGFLDSGKTSFINGILEDGFAREDKTLLICCEEGDEEYEKKALANVTVVTVDGEEVLLTRKEFRLLCDLLRNQGRVLTRDQIMEQVWGFDYGGATRTVDIHINTLRKKLKDNGAMIQTIRGVGYKIS